MSESAAPIVSIIVPVHNAARYLRECLDSALTQDFADFELLCVDDASTDESNEILAEYADRDGRIKVIEGCFDGPSATRNAALDCACGEYIACLDSDDMWAPGALAKMVGRAQETGADMVVFDYWLYYGGAAPVGTYRDQEMFARLDGIVTTFSDCPELAGFVGVWDRLFRRAYLEDAGIRFVGGRLYEDAMFCIDALVAGGTVAFMADHLYFYRRDVSGSITYTEDESINHKKDFIFAQAYIRARLLDAGASDEAWTCYAKYLAEYAYMHNRELHPFSRFADFFQAVRLLACSDDAPQLFELYEDDPNPGRAMYMACVANDQPRRAYAISNAANAAGRILHSS